MCLAVPMQLGEINKALSKGVAQLSGVRYEVDLSLLEDSKEGDYIIVHAGFAIERLDENEAKKRIALFNEIASNTSNES